MNYEFELRDGLDELAVHASSKPSIPSASWSSSKPATCACRCVVSRNKTPSLPPATSAEPSTRQRPVRNS